MKVKNLIKVLKTQDPEARVILSSDEEGNNMSPLYDTWGSGVVYVPDSDSEYCNYGEVHEKEDYLTDLEEQGIKPPPTMKEAVVLYPSN